MVGNIRSNTNTAVWAIAALAAVIVTILSGSLVGLLAFLNVWLGAEKAKTGKAIPRAIALNVGMVILTITLVVLCVPNAAAWSMGILLLVTALLP